MPLSVRRGIKKKHKKHGSKIWMSTYESARKQGKSKESAAKIAYSALNKESLSLSSIYESLLEAYPSKPSLGGRGQKILYKHIVPVLNSNWPGWETKFPQLKAKLDSDGDIDEATLSSIVNRTAPASMNTIQLVWEQALDAQEAHNPHKDFNPFAATPQSQSGNASNDVEKMFKKYLKSKDWDPRSIEKNWQMSHDESRKSHWPYVLRKFIEKYNRHPSDVEVEYIGGHGMSGEPPGTVQKIFDEIGLAN